MARLKMGRGQPKQVTKIEEPIQEVSLPFISHTTLNENPVEIVYIQTTPEVKEVIVEKIVEVQVPAQVIYQQVEVPVEKIVEVIIEKPVYVEVVRDVISYDNARIEALESELANVYDLNKKLNKKTNTLKIALVVTYALVIIGALLV